MEKKYKKVMPNGVTYYGTMGKFCSIEQRTKRVNNGKHTSVTMWRKRRRGIKWAW